MSRINASAGRNKRRAVFGVIALVVVVTTAIVVLPASGAAGLPSQLGVQPLEVALGGEAGDCKRAPVAGSGPSAGQYEFRIVNPTTGTFTDNQSGRNVTFKLTVTGGTALEYTVGGGAVFDLVTKGGAKSTWWNYDNPPAGSTYAGGPANADKKIHGPVKGSGDAFALSHVAFCYSLSGLSGSVWRDSNEDGARGSSESGLSGWTVRLFDVAASTSSTSVTDANGLYDFQNAVLGRSYVVCEESPAGTWTQTTPTTTPVQCTDEVYGHSIASLAIGQVANFGNVPTVASTCGNPIVASSPDGKLEYAVQVDETSPKCDDEFVISTYTEGATPFASLHGIVGSGSRASVIERITWAGYGSAQNPVSIWYDDSGPEHGSTYGNTKTPMLLCNYDPRLADGSEDGVSEFDLGTTPAPAGALPAGATLDTTPGFTTHTSCLIKAIDSAPLPGDTADGRIYTAYVYSSVDGLRGGQ